LARFTSKVNIVKDDIVEIEALKKNFTGLPIPAAAIAAVSINLFFLSDFGKLFNLSQISKVCILSFLMIFLGYCMVSKWKFPSLKSLNFKIRSFHLAFLSVILASFTLFGVLYYFSLVLLLLSWGYIVSAIILAIVRVIAGKKSKIFEDFEPEEDILD
jgi:CDP-diacylglycerol--serine O-phosphatidyltransferase